MPLRTALLIVVLATGCVAAPTTAPAEQSPKLEISTKQVVVEAGSPVWVEVTVSNPSDNELVLEITNGLSNLHYHVSYQLLPDQSPREVPSTEYGKSLQPTKKGPLETLPMRSRLIPPRGTATTRELVSRLYDMTLDGDYLISASRFIRRYPEVQSNTIRVRVKTDIRNYLSTQPTAESPSR